MFQYEFMRRAFAVIVIIAVIAPCIGMPIVMKRLSAIGDAASHSALAGVAFGLVFGVNPIVGAVIFAICAVLGIEAFRKAFGRFSELATVVVMSAGIGLTAVLSGFITNGSANLNSFMFGSVVAVSDFELWLTVGLGAAVIVVFALLHKEIFSISFDEEAAKIAGLPVKTVNFILMVLTAVTVAIASRVVGALMIASLMVIPVAAAMMLGKSYRATTILSVVFAEVFSIGGFILSYILDLRPGGTIVLIGVAALIVIMALFGRKR
ncbi:MAG: metal ABC transporter permease [Firmicutes bacterium]|nr:metal ABC transporter permease [Bacillota bacterium]